MSDWKIYAGEAWYGPYYSRLPLYENFFDNWTNHLVVKR
jgi:hypothetical protein